MVRTSRRGRDNPGSTPGEDILQFGSLLALVCVLAVHEGMQHAMGTFSVPLSLFGGYWLEGLVDLNLGVGGDEAPRSLEVLNMEALDVSGSPKRQKDRETKEI